MRLPIRTKIRLSPIIPFLLINFRPRPPKKISIAIEEVIQLIELILLK